MLSGRAYKTPYPQHYIIYKKAVPLLFSYLLLSPERNRNELETYHEQSPAVISQFNKINNL